MSGNPYQSPEPTTNQPIPQPAPNEPAPQPSTKRIISVLSWVWRIAAALWILWAAIYWGYGGLIFVDSCWTGLQSLPTATIDRLGFHAQGMVGAVAAPGLVIIFSGIALVTWYGAVLSNQRP